MEELLASLDPGKAALVRRYVKTLGPSAAAEQHQSHLSFSSDDSLGSDSLFSASQERAGGKKQPGAHAAKGTRSASPIASTELGEQDDAVVFVDLRCSGVSSYTSSRCVACVAAFVRLHDCCVVIRLSMPNNSN